MLPLRELRQYQRVFIGNSKQEKERVMPKKSTSKAHPRAQARLAGSRGKKEVPISRGRRLDAKKGNLAVEIERSGQPARLKAAISRLRTQRNALKELRVPQRDLDKAAALASAVGPKMKVQNLSGTRTRIVKGR